MNPRLPRAIVRNPRIPPGAGRMAIGLLASFALVSSACVGLAGCFSIYEQEHASMAGWRVAEVLAIGDSESCFVAAPRDCRDKGSIDARTATYVLLRHRSGRRFHRTDAKPIAANALGAEPGEFVHVKIAECVVPLLRRDPCTGIRSKVVATAHAGPQPGLCH